MYAVVYITAPQEAAERIARHLIERRLAACVNIAAPINSVYWWEGKVEEDKEALLIAKTKTDKLQELIAAVKAIHPYKVPEIIAVPIIGGNEDYIRWIDESIAQRPQA
ncbi:MAG: divalent-cation tolerance protein CutA [Thermoproteus sp. AZ2]|jgi:periplasmic divalent cation tolerance protein|uniref:Divalent-cation tolerance protein CutA n=1 Tax=Thermoproteus sp. AZ2 TaxID=1609232 RepID=A0ACC6V098_9CREN